MWVALELRVHGHRADSDILLAQAVERFETRRNESPMGERRAVGMALALLGRTDEAIGMLLELIEADTLRLDVKGMLGTAYAMQGDRARALQISEELARVQDEYLHGLPTLWRARIAGVLADRAQAVDLLRQAFSEGVRHDPSFPAGGTYWHSDPYFESLHDYEPFRELVKPKG